MFDYALIFLAIWLAEWSQSLLFSFCILIFIGIKQFSIGDCLLHESVHDNLIRPKQWNCYLAPLLAWPYMTTYKLYKSDHLLHHRKWRSDADPYLSEVTERVQKARSRLDLLFLVLFKVPILFFKRNIETLLSSKGFFLLLFWSLLFFLTFSLDGLGVLLFYWILPLFTVFPVVNFISEMADHSFCSDKMVRNLNGGIYNKLVAHNSGYHGVHHLRPDLPWFKLNGIYKNEPSVRSPDDCSNLLSFIVTLPKLFYRKNIGTEL